jgi:transposase
VLLYDLTSTYFESDPPFEETDKRQFGYSRDKRSDCVQVVIGLIITAEGFPLAYEVLPGNTSDKTTLRKFLRKIEEQYGKADRVWQMDRGAFEQFFPLIEVGRDVMLRYKWKFISIRAS